MKFGIVASLLALSSMANATVMHIVSVGKDGKLEFCPNQITANSGDLVQFQFYPKVYLSLENPTDGRITPLYKAFLPKVALLSRKLLLASPNLVLSVKITEANPRRLLWFHACLQHFHLWHNPHLHHHRQWNWPHMVVLLSGQTLYQRYGLHHQSHRRKDSRRIQSKLCQCNCQYHPWSTWL